MTEETFEEDPTISESPEARFSFMRSLMAPAVYKWLSHTSENFDQDNPYQEVNQAAEVLNQLMYGTICYIVTENTNANPASCRTIRVNLPAWVNNGRVIHPRGIIVALQIRLGALEDELKEWEQSGKVIEELYSQHMNYPDYPYSRNIQEVRVTKGTNVKIKDPSIGFFPNIRGE